MARRTSATAQTDTINDTENTETQENEMSVTTDETVADTATDQNDQNDPASAEVQVAETETPLDLSAFQEAVTEALGVGDEQTGTVPEQHLAKVNEAYRALEGAKGKNAAKKYLTEQMQAAVMANEMPNARTYLDISKRLSAAGGSTPKEKVEKAPADPTEALAQQFAILGLANSAVLVPDTIDHEKLTELVNSLTEAGTTQVIEYRDWLIASTNVEDGAEGPAEPEVENYIKNAAKLALGRSAKTTPSKSSGGGGGSTYSGPRRDVARHIVEAFGDKPSGHFMTIAQIADFASSEYPNPETEGGKVSQGAISARLFPADGKKMTVEGVTPTTQDSKKGAVKN